LVDDQILALLFLYHSEKGRKHCCKNFKNIHLQQKKVDYPATVDEMYHYLLHYNYEMNNENTQEPNTDSNSVIEYNNTTSQFAT